MSALLTIISAFAQLSPSTAELQLEADASGLKISSVFPGGVLTSALKTSIGESKTKYVLPSDQLKSALGKSPSSAEIQLTESGTLLVKTTRTKIELTMKEIHRLVLTPEIPKGSSSFAFSEDLRTNFNAFLPMLGLEKLHVAQPEFRLHIQITEKSVFFVTYDSFQLAYLKVRNTFGIDPGDYNVPYSMFSSLMKKMPSLEATVSIATDSLHLSSKIFSAYFAMAPRSENEPDGKERIEKIQEFQADPDYKFVIQCFPLKEFVDKCRSVSSDDSRLTFQVNGKGLLQVSAVASAGKASTVIPFEEGSLKEPFALETRVLKNLLSKTTDTDSLLAITVKDGVLSFRSERGVTFLSAVSSTSS